MPPGDQSETSAASARLIVLSFSTSMLSTSLVSTRRWEVTCLAELAGKPPVSTVSSPRIAAMPSAPAITAPTTSWLVWEPVSATTCGAMLSSVQKSTTTTSSTTAISSARATSSASEPQSDTLSVQTKLRSQPRLKPSTGCPVRYSLTRRSLSFFLRSDSQSGSHCLGQVLLKLQLSTGYRALSTELPGGSIEKVPSACIGLRGRYLCRLRPPPTI